MESEKSFPHFHSAGGLTSGSSEGGARSTTVPVEASGIAGCVNGPDGVNGVNGVNGVDAAGAEVPEAPDEPMGVDAAGAEAVVAGVGVAVVEVVVLLALAF